MVLHAINLGILVLLFFVVGMFKPNWALFFMKNPNRWIVIAVTTVFFMIVMTMYGEGIKQAKMTAKHKKPVAASTTAPVPVPIPEPVPVPVPVDKPKQAAKHK